MVIHYRFQVFEIIRKKPGTRIFIRFSNGIYNYGIPAEKCFETFT